MEFLPAADLILVLKDGRIILAGKYDEPLQAGTYFKTLVAAQHEAVEATDAAYKELLIPLIIHAQGFQFLQIESSWWMAWANPQTAGDQPKVGPMVLLDFYMALAFESSWFIFVRALLVATFGLAAAQKLFLKMLTSVFQALMSFFDTTSAGWILNCVSIDQTMVDLDIPFRLGGFASITIQLLRIVGLMTQVT